MRQAWLFMARRILNIELIADIVVNIGKVLGVWADAA